MYKNRLGAYHQCYKNRKATEFAMQNFIKHNPIVPYCLISDAGEDFSDLAEKYECEYLSYDTNVGMDYLPKEHAKLLLKRLEDCFNLLDVEYLILMEDDVYCRGQLDFEFDFDLGVHYVPGNKLYLYDKILKYNSKPDVDWYGACGGSIVNRKLFSDQNWDKINKFLDEDFDPIAGSMDQLITHVYLVCGYKIKELTSIGLLGEVTRNANWMNTNIPIIHQYKNEY
jgi:hypothetical protein